MGRVIFLAHLPTLRIEMDTKQFAAGDLWRMPFDVFDDLSMGAFTDHRSEYDAASPVFYRVPLNLQLAYLKPPQNPESGSQEVIEIKARSDDPVTLQRLGLGIFDAFHAQIAGPAWAALSLAAPAAALPFPRLSCTFAVAQEEEFHVANMASTTIRVQGEADLEYLFLAHASGRVLLEEVLDRADALTALTRELETSGPIGAATDVLLTASAPPLGGTEQMTLAVMALEALLMPEVRSGLGKTFAQRLSALLAHDQAGANRLRKVASSLYHLRSASVHGQVRPDDAGPVSQAHAQQLLGAAIVALAERSKTEPLEQVRASLDAGIPSRAESDSLPEPSPAGLRSAERLSRRPGNPSVGFSSGASLQPPDGKLLSWAPLPGLGIEEDVAMCGPSPVNIGNAGRPILVPLDGNEVLSLEDKDIRRDFIAELRLAEGKVASIATAMPAREYAGIAGAEVILRSRDLAVIALRIAGFRRFHDPRLLGQYIYSGPFLHRKATVFRQTVLEELRHAPEQTITAADVPRTAPAWALLARYENEGRHGDIEAILTAYRRVFDRRFLPWRSRAGLLLAALEGMLGRFRGKGEKIQLEDLIEAAAGSNQSAAWFRAHGRTFRNAVAHGGMPEGAQATDGIERTLDVVSALIPFLLESWLASDRARRPGSVMIHAAAARLG